MSDRTVPFDEFAICDTCGKIGSFNIMGDFYCAECLAEIDKEPSDLISWWDTEIIDETGDE